MRKYSFFRAIPLSFFSRLLYRDVATQWKGYGFIHLAGMICIHLLLTYSGYMINYNPLKLRQIPTETNGSLSSSLNNVAAYLLDVMDQLPDITIKDGKAHVDVPVPHVIKSSVKEDMPVIIIDTSGKTTDLKDSPAILLITDKSIIAREKSGEKVYYEFDKSEDRVITNEMFIRWLRWLPVPVFPGDFLSLFLHMLTVSLMFGLLAGIFCSIHKIENVRYRDLVRLSCIAAFPGLVIEGVANFFGVALFKHADLIYFLMQAAYVYHAVESNAARYTGAGKTD